jgi:hypothetical protein
VRARTWGILWVATALAKLICVGALITTARAPTTITPAPDASSARSPTVATHRPDRKRLDEQRERAAAAPVESVSRTASLVPAPAGASGTTTEYPLALSP